MLYLCWFGYFWEWIFHFILIHPRWIGIVSNRHNVTKTLRASRLWEHTQQSHCIHLTQPPHKFLTVHWKQGSSQQAPTTPVHCKMAHGVCVSMVNGFVPLTNKKLKSPDRKAVLQPSSPAVSQLSLNADFISPAPSTSYRNSLKTQEFKLLAFPFWPNLAICKCKPLLNIR